MAAEYAHKKLVQTEQELGDLQAKHLTLIDEHRSLKETSRLLESKLARVQEALATADGVEFWKLRTLIDTINRQLRGR
jgi:hypothetical protein